MCMKIMALVSFLVVFNLVGCANQETKNVGASAEATTANNADKTAPIAGSGAGVLLIKDVAFDADAVVPEAVKNECKLPSSLSAQIRANVAQHYATVLEGSAVAPDNADVLSIEIVNLIGSGGGAWSGGKSVMIKGTLSKQGKAVASFKALRVSGGGYFGAYMGTCAILGRCVRTLGKDVAGWLQNPTPNATLGNM
jgi:hypothetical protein